MGTPIIVEQKFNIPMGELWTIISDPYLMRQWFFAEIPDFKAEVGFQTRFNVNAGVRDFMHLWEIVEVEHEAKIVYDWRYEGYIGNGLVTFELVTQDNGCLLRVVSEGMDSFPQEIPEFSRESCEGGWTYFIKQSLVKFVTKAE